MRLHAAMALTAVLALAPAAALGQSVPPPSPAMPATPGRSAMPDMKTQADREMMDAMTRMNQAMDQAAMTGDPDKDFVKMMMPHHQAAIDMAAVELTYGKNPAVRKLATRIITAQKKEIGEMQRWLAAHS